MVRIVVGGEAEGVGLCRGAAGHTASDGCLAGYRHVLRAGALINMSEPPEHRVPHASPPLLLRRWYGRETPTPTTQCTWGERPLCWQSSR